MLQLGTSQVECHHLYPINHYLGIWHTSIRISSVVQGEEKVEIGDGEGEVWILV
jgi:hypothetical protein